jgi:hypothetical protein
MRTVLGRTAGRASLILVSAGVVGSAALPAVPAAAGAGTHVHRASAHHPVTAGHHKHRSDVQIGTAVKYVRNPDGSVRRVR